MRKVLGLAVGAAMMAAAPVQAAEWWYLGKSSNNTIFFIDLDSLSFDGNNRKFWYHAVLSKLEDGVKSEKAFKKINCELRVSSSLSFINYDQNGASVGSHTYAYPKDEPIAPETMMDAMREFVCLDPSKWSMIDAYPISGSPDEFARQVHTELAGKK